jgi:hypothetical protein
MRRVLIVLAAGALVSALAPALAAPARGDTVRSAVEWKGELKDEELEREKPAGGLVTEPEAFAKLWKAWRGGEEVPTVNFKSYVVVVATSRQGRLLGLSLDRGDKGNAKAVAGLGSDPVKGCSYVIGVFRRTGVKTIDGKPISKE